MSGTIFTVNCCTYTMQVPAEAGDLRFWRNTSVASATGTSTLADGTLGYEWDEDLDNGSRPGGEIDLSSTTVNVPERITDQGSNYGPGTATHSLTLHRVGNALVFAAGTVQWSWGFDGTHDRGGSTPSTAMRQATVNLFADMGVQPGSLQAGLTAATASTDTTPPTATTDAPASDDRPGRNRGDHHGHRGRHGRRPRRWRRGLHRRQHVASRERPRRMELHVHALDAAGALSIRSRATDDSVNTGAASAPVSAHGQPTASLSVLAVERHGDAGAPRRRTTAAPIEIGTRFTSDVDGTITARPVLQGRGQHRRAHRPPLEGRRHAARDTARSRARPPRAGSRPRSTTPVADHRRHAVRRVELLAVGLLRVRPAATSRCRPSTTRRCTRRQDTRRRAERRLPVRRGAPSRRPASTGSNYWVDVVLRHRPRHRPRRSSPRARRLRTRAMSPSGPPCACSSTKHSTPTRSRTRRCSCETPATRSCPRPSPTTPGRAPRPSPPTHRSHRRPVTP